MYLKDIAFEFFIMIVLGIFVGYIIAEYTNDNIWVVVFLLLGIFCAFGRLFKMIKDYEKGDFVGKNTEKKDK
ncbi:MAG: AtpZ/AtpI family protein [Methanocaldococcus sp.]